MNCKKFLKPIEIKEEEFKKLCDAFLEPVLIGKDIFLKTRPEEFQDYLSFLKKVGKVDVVLDGLNIAYAAGAKTTPFVFSKMVYTLYFFIHLIIFSIIIKICILIFQLKDVVCHYVKQSKKVMILGRKHMANWPKQNMSYVTKNAAVFLAENM